MELNIGIAERDRQAVAASLSHFLADTYSLYLKTHGYHWNVTGPMFDSLHSMFMGQYSELWTAIDEIAERIRALGEYAPAGYGKFAQLSSISEDVSVPTATDMIRNLVQGHEAVIRTARSTFPIAEQAGDQVTLDLLTQRLQIHEKTAWMLRSLLAKE